MDRTTVVEQMYQGYLDAHDMLAAGTLPSDIPQLAEFSARMDDATVFYVGSLELELRGREEIERFLVESRQTLGLREVPERVFQHGDLVVAFNRVTITGAGGDASVGCVSFFV